MSVRLFSYLHRNRCGVFGFRIVIPRDLRALFPRVEYRRSLRTSDLRTAKRTASRLAFFIADRFDRLRRMTKDARSITARQIIAELGEEGARVDTEIARELGDSRPNP